jgi:hypothetical protein
MMTKIVRMCMYFNSLTNCSVIILSNKYIGASSTVEPLMVLLCWALCYVLMQIELFAERLCLVYLACFVLLG